MARMAQESKLALMKDRLAKLENTPKNLKCPGTVRALRREIRNLESDM